MNPKRLTDAECAGLVVLLVSMPEGVPVSELTREGLLRLGTSPKSVKIACQRLRARGLVEKVGSCLRLTETGMAMMGSVAPTELVEKVRRKVITEMNDPHASLPPEGAVHDLAAARTNWAESCRLQDPPAGLAGESA